MLRVCPDFSSGAEEKERTIMGNAAVAEELPGADELDELYRLDASETEPEDDEDERRGRDDERHDEDDEDVKPEGMPHH